MQHSLRIFGISLATVLTTFFIFGFLTPYPVFASANVEPVAPAIRGAASAPTYTVVWGDTLSDIAGRYNVNIDNLARANHIDNVDLIYEGQQLAIPGTSAPSPSTPYVIQPGDCFWTIAQRYGIDMYDLARVNGLDINGFIYPDQVLTIPNSTAEPVPAPNPSNGSYGLCIREPVYTVHQWDAAFNHAGNEYGVPANLLRRMATVESTGNPNAYSPNGAIGLMQIMPFNAWFGENLWDPWTNIHVGARVLRANFNIYNSWQQAVGGYFGFGGSDAFGQTSWNYINQIFCQ